MPCRGGVAIGISGLIRSAVLLFVEKKNAPKSDLKGLFESRIVTRTFFLFVFFPLAGGVDFDLMLALTQRAHPTVDRFAY